MSTSCLGCKKFKLDKKSDAIIRIKSFYESSNEDFFLGFSGGKDSSALLALTLRAIQASKERKRTLRVVYCNTGVEIPIIAKHTSKKISAIRRYCLAHELPVQFHVAVPRITDRFFVKVIGRGYVPPTNKFRWCTDRLRINPVDRLIRKYSQGHQPIILLGVRNGESHERDRIIAKYDLGGFMLRQEGRTDRIIFAPILDFSTEHVWGVISDASDIFGTLSSDLLQLYRDASGECPTIRDPRASPCSQGRFGCWTCTVVRKDRSVTNLITAGDSSLEPLLGFRNWLATVRDDPRFRESKRRNGSPGMGPFTIRARKEILNRLKLAEKKSGMRLILKSEIHEIEKLWLLDTPGKESAGQSRSAIR